MTNDRKDTVLQIRLSSKLLSDFKSKCENSTPKIIPAEWLRNNIDRFMREDNSDG